MRSFRKKRSNTKPLVYVLLLVAVAALWYLLNNTQATTPALALAKARALIADGKIDEASTFIKIADQDKSLSNWIALEKGKSAEASGNTKKSLKIYNGIEQSSPAVLDARLQIFELEHKEESTERLLSLIEELSSQFVKAGRTDLFRKLYLLSAEQLFKNQQIDSAHKLVSVLRDRHPRSLEAVTALELRELYIDDSELAPVELEKEAHRFLREGDAERTLEILEKLYPKLPEDSADTFRVKLFEEKVLRHLQRHEEADRLLLLISADGPPEIADQAMLLIAKKAWNVNNHDRALTFVNNGLERFPSSELTSEMLYVKARILEELAQYQEAKEIYTLASEDDSSSIPGMRALLRVSWLYYMSDNQPFAASFFQKAGNRAQSYLRKSTTKEKDLREVREIHDEARFWEAAISSTLSKDELTVLKARPITLDALTKALSPYNAPTYYSVAAHSLLGTKDPLDFIQDPSPNNCSQPLPSELKTLLDKLKRGGLDDLVLNELLWFFAGNNNQESATSSRIALAVALAKNGLASEAIREGRPLLDELLNPTDPSRAIRISKCSPELIEATYPVSHFDKFQSAAKQNNLPVSLLLAIAHTESSFDETALSVAKARGLMQLMEKTAIQEGLTEGEDLFSPAVNIRLGSKHLRRLMNVYNDELIYSVAAYNAGGAAVNRWKTRFKKIPINAWVELIGYPETKRYVKKVILAQFMYDYLLND